MKKTMKTVMISPKFLWKCMYCLFDQEISIKGIFQICIAFAETLHIH